MALLLSVRKPKPSVLAGDRKQGAKYSPSFTFHSIFLYNQLCKAAPLDSEMRNKDQKEKKNGQNVKPLGELPSDLWPSSFSLAEDSRIPSHSWWDPYPGPLGADMLTGPERKSDSAKYQFWKSERTSYDTSPTPPSLSLHYILYSFLYFFSSPCLGQRGSCKVTERHWSPSAASADKPASHSGLAGGNGPLKKPNPAWQGLNNRFLPHPGPHS